MPDEPQADEPSAPRRPAFLRGETRGPEARSEPPLAGSAVDPGDEAIAPSPVAPDPVAQPPSARKSAADDRADPRPREPKRPSTDELLSRPFAAESSTPPTGQNLRFEFNEELPHLDETDDSVIEPPPPPRRPPIPPRQVNKRKTLYSVEAPEPMAPADRFEIGNPELESPAPPAKRQRSRAAEFVDESEAPLYNRGATHSARFFIAMAALIGLGFALMTLMIHSAPATARELLNRLPGIGDRFASPLTPAQMVVLHDVRTSYEAGRGGHQALVIKGSAENVSSTTLGAVRIAARLTGAGADSRVAREVYCGNTLGNIAQMTPHEIDFYQSRAPEGFSLAAAASCPFVVVFLDPPGTTQVALAVTEASPVQPDPGFPPSPE